MSSIYAVILDANVQSMMARSLAGFLSNKVDTEVKIKTFYITPDMRIHAEEVMLNDKYHQPLFYIGNLDAKLSLRDFKNGLRVRSINLSDVNAFLVKYEGDKSMNLTQILNPNGIKNDKTEKNKSNFSIIVDNLNLDNGHLIVNNKNKESRGKSKMEYHNLNIDSIYASFSELSFKDNIVSGYINKLAAKDKSGLHLEDLSSKSKVVVSDKGLDFKNLKLKTHATQLDMDLSFLYNSYRDYVKFVDSIRINAKIRPSVLTLSDLEYFSNTLGKMKDTLKIEGLINGYVRDFEFSNFKFNFKDSTEFLGTIKMKGLPDFFDTHIVADVEKMTFTYEDISQFYIPTPTNCIPLPKNLSSIKEATLSGNYDGFHNNFTTSFNLHTNIGNVYLAASLNNDILNVSKPHYNAKIYANNIQVNKIAGLDEDILLSMESRLDGTGLSKNDADFNITLDVEKLKIANNNLNDLSLSGDFENQRFIFTSYLNDKLIRADVCGLIDVIHEQPSFDINLYLKDVDLYGLNIIDKDKTMIFNSQIKANFQGIKIDEIYGNLIANNTSLYDSRGYYHMDSLSMSLTKNDFNSKNINLVCDFLDLDINGIVNIDKIDNSFKNYLLNHFHINKWTDRNIKLHDNHQDFYVNLVFKNTETLSRLLLPKLHISNNTNLTATFTSNNYMLNSTLVSEEITYNNIRFVDLNVKNKTSNKKTTVTLQLDDLIFKDSTDNNPLKLSMENLNLLFDIHNDSILFDFAWNDNIIDDRNKGDIDAFYVMNDNNEGKLNISSFDVIINDTTWHMTPNSYIDFKNDKTIIKNFDFYTQVQSLKIDGYYPKTSADTLYISFHDFNISNVDVITTPKGLNFDGVINGDLQMSGISDKFTFLSNLDILNIGINNHIVGDGVIDANWNAPDTSIYIDTHINRKNNNEKLLALNGNYYTSRNDNNIDFDVLLRDIDVSIIKPFTKKILSDVKGKINSDLKISGSFKKIVMDGNASLYDAACKINYLNTYYKINPSNLLTNKDKYTIKLSKNLIEFNDILLVDTLNNQAIAKGIITHNHLKDFVFDVDLAMSDFLAMNMLPTETSTFYGTAVVNGDLKIEGPLDDISIDINAESMPGTSIDILLTNTNSLNNNFIVFIQKENKEDTVKTIVPEYEKNNKLTLNLNADITQNADVNIFLPSNMGVINANGNGNIRLGYALNQLSLYGDFIINDGNFNFNFQNLVRRNFNIRNGGSIRWTGNAADADINITGSYRTKSSISSLGIEIDSTSLVNNINVDCILRLQDKLTSPSITFGLELPNATDDISNTIFSIIDTTNQSVMSQQIISLLVLGSFSYTSTSLYSIGASNYYNVISNSLSNWLSQISKDLNVGVRYTPEDNITAEELEVALSTQLFNDRLTIESNLGMYTGAHNEITQNANNIVGDVDITFKINNRLSMKFYNHSNFNSNYYSYTYETYSDYTQGIGISYSQSFDSLKEIFTRKKKNKKTNMRNNDR